MIQIKQAIIVEGKYDKIKLSSIIDGIIITTNGFSIFKDKEKVDLIRFYAKNKGIIILTDSDSAGFKIRSYIKSFVNSGEIVNVYVPDIFGKERRKIAPSKEGKLGVEGIKKEIIIEAFTKAGILLNDKTSSEEKITRLDLFDDGLSGGANSRFLRKELLRILDLPELLTTSSMLEALNSMLTYEEYKMKIDEIKKLTTECD